MFRKRDWSLRGERVVLVPYCRHHVHTYHQWMQDPMLLAQTASESLSLEQEYAMQESWMKDDDKATFILLSSEVYQRPGISETDCMVGDINLFLTDSSDLICAEIDVMIAKSEHRRQGMGAEAVHLMMSYGVTELGVRRFTAKIKLHNQPSLNLFKNIGFVEVSQSEAFEEATFEYHVEWPSQVYTVQEERWSKYSYKK